MMMGGDSKKIASIIIGKAMKPYRDAGRDEQSHADAEPGMEKMLSPEGKDEESGEYNELHGAAGNIIAAVHNRDHRELAKSLQEFHAMAQNKPHEMAGGPYAEDMKDREPYEE